jgi:hypothetical protein
MRRLTALVFVAAALIAGCGSDDEPAAPAAAPTATPSPDGDRGSYGY